ncbi:hypothetical protein SAMN05216207_100282 [Pseudonocardia ammonioxydans]|uniref:MmpS family membrane protein n=1 Tax=Pseudonocardia ammonioxydans TaxID=260086 RepID=A0A1I4T3C6_PSUAM|nr:hypothetical protein [Pseudonocardia ammonioxydans]SFM71254.1 hypothetical protein SAMN05216207_100282 [Pseudonocardia ammonioxydans]
MGGVGPGEDGDVERRWQAIRAGVDRRSVPAAPAPTPRRGRTRRAAGLVAVVAAFSVVSFLAGWMTGLSGHGALPPATTAVGAPQPVAAPAVTVTPPTGAAPTPAAPTPAAPAPETYTYVVDSNHPVRVSYIDSAGEKVHRDSLEAPWTLKVDTTEWGADTRPSLMVMGADHGDTFVSCTVTDGNGQVVAGDRKETSDPVVICSRR